jgi:tRNA nucleotidyltransferase/poly(A) polymerase
LGIKDIQSKQLKTCLAPGITLGLDNKRVVRILYLAAKLGFTVDESIIRWVKAHPASLSNVKPQYLSKKLQKALDYNTEVTLQLLDQMELWSHVPPLPALLPYMSQNVKRI